jgi:hypothetical protein
MDNNIICKRNNPKNILHNVKLDKINNEVILLITEGKIIKNNYKFLFLIFKPQKVLKIDEYSILTPEYLYYLNQSNYKFKI